MMNNIELVEITPFKASDGEWYFRLGYEYEDEKGVHSYVVPKAAIPFCSTELPDIHYPSSPISREPPYIWCGGDTMYLKRGFYDSTTERADGVLAYEFDIVTMPATREMTLDEIEKELGYKVKIVEREKSNGTDNL